MILGIVLLSMLFPSGKSANAQRLKIATVLKVVVVIPGVLGYKWRVSASNIGQSRSELRRVERSQSTKARPSYYFLGNELIYIILRQQDI